MGDEITQNVIENVCSKFIDRGLGSVSEKCHQKQTEKEEILSKIERRS
jgi:hypothetical protein